MPLRLVWLRHDGGTAGSDATLEIRLAAVLGRVPAQPLARAGQLPGGFEVLRVVHEAARPDGLRLLCRGKDLALPIERIGIGRLRAGQAYGKEQIE